jgi:hypothetical protein
MTTPNYAQKRRNLKYPGDDIDTTAKYRDYEGHDIGYRHYDNDQHRTENYVGSETNFYDYNNKGSATNTKAHTNKGCSIQQCTIMHYVVDKDQEADPTAYPSGSCS